MCPFPVLRQPDRSLILPAVCKPALQFYQVDLVNDAYARSDQRQTLYHWTFSAYNRPCMKREQCKRDLQGPACDYHSSARCLQSRHSQQQHTASMLLVLSETDEIGAWTDQSSAEIASPQNMWSQLQT